MSPPSEYRSNTVDLTLKNSQRQVTLIKEAQSLQTRYRLSVANPLVLGLPSVTQSNINNFFRDVVLAFNLILDTTALSIRGQNVSEYGLKYKEAEQEVEENSEGSGIAFDDTLHFDDRTSRTVRSNKTIHLLIDDRSHVMTKSSEIIDENELIYTLNLINKAVRHGYATRSNRPFQTIQKLTDLSKALHNYEIAMSVFDALTIFRHLYTSLELATNSDGTDRHNQSLDAEIACLTQIPEKDAEDWRLFYNRVKHVNRDQTDLTTFERGMKNLPHQIYPLRISCKKVIIERLKKL
jgi:hypothetical protein